MKHVDFFSSPIGLGHVTRDIAIAEKFDPKFIHTKFISGASATKILNHTNIENVDAYVPPSFVIIDGVLQRPAKWLWSYYRYYKDCKRISREILFRDKPNIIVSDEDFASLANAQKMNIPAVLVTDVLQTRLLLVLVSLIEKRMNKSMQNIIKNADAVIVPDYGNDTDNITMVGPIVRHTKFTRAQLRKQFGFERKTILVSIGGTDAGVFLIERILNLIPKISRDVDVVVVAGPAVQKQFSNVRNLGWVDNLHELIFASDVLVSLAGRSTIDEAAAYGTPAVFIPIKGHFEQEDNATRLGFTFEDVYRLDVLIAEKLSQERKPVAANGAAKAAQIIQNLC